MIYLIDVMGLELVIDIGSFLGCSGMRSVSATNREYCQIMKSAIGIVKSLLKRYTMQSKEKGLDWVNQLVPHLHLLYGCVKCTGCGAEQFKYRCLARMYEDEEKRLQFYRCEEAAVTRAASVAESASFQSVGTDRKVHLMCFRCVGEKMHQNPGYYLKPGTTDALRQEWDYKAKRSKWPPGPKQAARAMANLQSNSGSTGALPSMTLTRLMYV